MNTLRILILLAVIALPTASLAATIDAGGDTGFEAVIDSEPQGAPFALEGRNRTTLVTGNTPTRVTNIPSSWTIVHFGDVPGCITPKPQQRSVSEPVHYFGRYQCPPPAPRSGAMGSVRLAAHQAETLPGSTFKYSLAVHNHGATPLNGASALFEYNPSQISLHDLPQLGRIQSPGLARWPVPAVRPGETWLVVFQATVASAGIPDGSQINATASLTGVPSQSTATTSVGLPYMPRTGVPFATIFVLLSLLGAAVLTLPHSLVHHR